MLGVAAATALPSAVWPFRKIFLPTVNTYLPMDYVTRLDLMNGKQLTLADVAAVQLEQFAKEIPDLIFRDSVYRYFKRRAAEAVLTNGIAFIDRNGVYTYNEDQQMIKISETPMRMPLTLNDEDVRAMNAAYVNSDLIVTGVDPIEKSVTLAPAKRSLLHAPATPENIMEFIDGLESDLSES